jgi:HK97 family phage major capsid protein
MTTMQDLIDSIDRMNREAGAALARADDRVAEIRERVEELEAGRSMPGKTAGETAESREHRRRFDAWVRRPNDESTKAALREFESKAVNIATPSDGGHAVPEEIAREVERLEIRFSPVRRLVRVLRASTGDFKHLVNIRGAASGWAGESTSRAETATPELREVAPTFGELYAYPQTTEWALDDVFFDVGAWLAEEVAQQFALAEGEAVIRGDGSNKPTGMLDTPPTTAVDFASPLRAAAVYQYINCAASGSPAAAAIQPDCLIDMLYAVASQYRANGTFVMNSSTAAAVRKLKDADNNYLWLPGLVAGQPDRLLGYPVETWEQMDDVGDNDFPIAFGDFRRGYLLVDRTTLRITVDANITTPGRVKFYVRRREGGQVLNNDAIKFLRTAAAA